MFCTPRPVYPLYSRCSNSQDLYTRHLGHFLSPGKKSSLEYNRRPLCIGDPDSYLIRDSQICFGVPKFFILTPDFRWKPQTYHRKLQAFHWRPPDFHWRPQFSIFYSLHWSCSKDSYPPTTWSGGRNHHLWSTIGDPLSSETLMTVSMLQWPSHTPDNLAISPFIIYTSVCSKPNWKYL